MRIEISSSGLCGATISELESNLATYIGDAEGIIASFKTIKESALGLNGGVGNLQGAFDNVESRIQNDDNKLQEAKNVQNKVNEFVSLATRVDNAVSDKVNNNKKEMYEVNAWLKPAVSVEEEIPWYEQAWNWLCDARDKIADTAVKVWNTVVEFYNEHEKQCKQILIGLLAIGIAVIVVVATVGSAAVLPAVLAMAKAAVVSGLISAVISGGVSVAFCLANGGNFDEILHEGLKSAADGFCGGFMWGAVFSSVTQIISIARFSSMKTIDTNRIRGKQCEDYHFSKFQKKHMKSQRQITLETTSGTRTKVDQIGLDKRWNIIINEIKSSSTAPLTIGQEKAFPEIFKSGAVVKGAGKGIFKGGFIIPPGTKVEVIRSSYRFIDFDLYTTWTSLLGGTFGSGDVILSEFVKNHE